jgi:cytoskeletal protein CcmA (bactofilin family)
MLLKQRWAARRAFAATFTAKKSCFWTARWKGRNRLTIGPNGKVKATVKAREIIVRGSVQGNVEASDRISIMNGASIVGDVKTAGIVIEDGAYFKGGIDILRPEVNKKPSGAGNDKPQPSQGSNQASKSQTVTA